MPSDLPNTDPEWAIMEKTLIGPMADFMLSQEVPNALELSDQKKHRLMEQFRPAFERYQESFANVGRLLKKEGFKAKCMEAPDFEKRFIDDALTQADRVLKEGLTIQKVFGLTDDELDAVADIGRKYYSDADYTNARDIFMFLTNCNPGVARFWMGLGMSEQMGGHFDTALNAYGIAAQINDADPSVYLYVANCLVHVDHAAEAVQLLDNLIVDLTGKRQWTNVKDQAEALRKEWAQAA